MKNKDGTGPRQGREHWTSEKQKTWEGLFGQKVYGVLGIVWVLETWTVAQRISGKGHQCLRNAFVFPHRWGVGVAGQSQRT